jgi:hypothetical protein
MKLPRRKFLQVAAGTAALPSVMRVAKAQTYWCELSSTSRDNHSAHHQMDSSRKPWKQKVG